MNWHKFISNWIFWVIELISEVIQGITLNLRGPRVCNCPYFSFYPLPWLPWILVDKSPGWNYPENKINDYQDHSSEIINVHLRSCRSIQVLATGGFCRVKIATEMTSNINSTTQKILVLVNLKVKTYVSRFRPPVKYLNVNMYET